MSIERFSDVTVVTVTTRNYLHRVRLLMESVKEWIPGARRLVCCVDSFESFVDPQEENFEVVDAADLAIPRYPQLAVALNPTALCCALKPFAVAHALKDHGVERILYLDNDMGLYQTPADILDGLATHSFMLTPHHLSPLPPGARPNEMGLNSYGTFNAGMFAFRKCPQSMDFIHWWSCWLLDPRHLEVYMGYDQCWLNYVPVYCPQFGIVRDTGYNVAFWNLVERNLQQAGTEYRCGGAALATFHFSHFDETRPSELGPSEGDCNFQPTAATRALGEGIAAGWEKHGRKACLAWGYGYNKWPDGTDLLEAHRHALRSVWDEIPMHADPFSPEFRKEHPIWFKMIRVYPKKEKSGFTAVIRRFLDVSPLKVCRLARKVIFGK